MKYILYIHCKVNFIITNIRLLESVKNWTKEAVASDVMKQLVSFLGTDSQRQSIQFAKQKCYLGNWEGVDATPLGHVRVNVPLHIRYTVKTTTHNQVGLAPGLSPAKSGPTRVSSLGNRFDPVLNKSS